MKIEIAKKLIMVLLVILVISIGLTMFLIYKTGNSGNPAVTDPLSDFTDTEPDETDDTDEPTGTTTPGGTDPVSPGTTEPPVVDPPIVDPPIVTDPPVTNPPVTDPPVTDPPVTEDPNANKAPAGFSLDKTFTTDTGVLLNLIAECHATRNSDGSVNLTVELYLDHRALSMGARNCVLTVGNTAKEFVSDRIRQDANTPSKPLLQSVSGTFAYGETVKIYAKVPVGLTNYGGVQIKSLIIDVSLPLK
jgi:hypothetical protein